MKIMAIDGNSILNRSFYGIRMLTNHEGMPTNAIYGFLATVFRLQDEERPDRIIACFDVKEKTFRHLKFPSYKATRKGMPEELAVQLPVLKEVLDAMGIIRTELSGYEADDLLGTISRRAKEEGHTCVIITGDRDSLQLIGDGTTVHLISTRKGQPVSETYDTEKFREQYGFAPIHLIDLKALMGDASDHISGVPGIGEKTAMQLMHDFGTLDDIYKNLNLEEKRMTKSVRAKLQAGEQAARDSFWLATIDQNAPLAPEILNLSALPEPKMNQTVLYELLTRLEFQSFFKRFGFSGATERTVARPPDTSARRVSTPEEAFSLLDDLSKQQAVMAVIPETLEVICLLAGEADTAQVLFAGDFPSAWESILRGLFHGRIPLVLHHAKPVMAALLARGIEPEGIMFDTCLAAYLLNPTQNAYDLPLVTLACCQTVLPSLDLDDPAALSPLGGQEDTMRGCAVHSAAVRAIYHETAVTLKKYGLQSLYYKTELPLTRVLAEMEVAGCTVDPVSLRVFGQKLDGRITALVDMIYEDAGVTFNINSTKQLGEILFEKLGLPAPKKTKTGYSTNVEVLEQLADQHPIIPAILEYRQLTKLKSTYVEGLLKVIHPKDGRVHTHFQQTVTATGRLSSTDPNLQNIPVRTELGRELRKMFVAPDENHVLIDADYSQIELRVLAHLSQDAHMMEAFRAGQDIHTLTAAKVYHVPPEEVSPAMRSSCKAVNFGIVYGISDFSLAQDIGVTKKEAGAFIQAYLDTYPGVARYMDEIRTRAKEQGYVTTLCGRRRPLPELKSSQFKTRSFGERAAMNTPVQGTAADIIKIAMIRVRDRLRREQLQSRLILQVHDELILEAPVAEQESVMRLLTEEMENALPLDVPLVAEAKAGHSWYDAK